MREQTGENYQGAQYAKTLAVGKNKQGKSTFLVSSILGLLPWQKHGGVVEKPEDLHIITFDSSALAGIRDFMTKVLNAPPEAHKFTVWNFQDDVRAIAESTKEYDHAFYGSLATCRNKIADRVGKSRGVPVVLLSSLTGLAPAVERAIVGPPTGGSTGKGYGDQSKWKMVSSQLFEIQNLFQVDDWHCIWEGHVTKKKIGKDDEKDTLSVSGKAGDYWAYNVEQVFGITRQFGTVHPGTKCDKVYLDTQPTLDFLANARGATTALNKQEADLTEAYEKLGLRVGHWGLKR